MSARASGHEGKSPSSHSLNLIIKTDLHTCIGGLEASMQLIMDHLQIPPSTSNLAENRQTKMPSAHNSAAKTTKEDNCMELMVENLPQAHIQDQVDEAFSLL
jgi:formiminotetrahydrofolate cyclodeaminase